VRTTVRIMASTINLAWPEESINCLFFILFLFFLLFVFCGFGFAWGFFERRLGVLFIHLGYCFFSFFSIFPHDFRVSVMFFLFVVLMISHFGMFLLLYELCWQLISAGLDDPRSEKE